MQQGHSLEHGVLRTRRGRKGLKYGVWLRTWFRKRSSLSKNILESTTELLLVALFGECRVCVCDHGSQLCYHGDTVQLLAIRCELSCQFVYLDIASALINRQLLQLFVLATSKFEIKS